MAPLSVRGMLGRMVDWKNAPCAGLALVATLLSAGCRAPEEIRNVPYDTRYDDTVLDMYLPDGDDTGRVAVMLVHGGAWYSGDKNHFDVRPDGWRDWDTSRRASTIGWCRLASFLGLRRTSAAPWRFCRDAARSTA